MLAAVLSKMGIYGFLRFANPMFPETARSLAPIFIALAIVGIVYGAMVAVAQTDIKRLLAYSSISHVSLIVLGVFAALLAGRNADLARTWCHVADGESRPINRCALLVCRLVVVAPPHSANEFVWWTGAGQCRSIRCCSGSRCSLRLFAWTERFVGEYLILHGRDVRQLLVCVWRRHWRCAGRPSICCACAALQCMVKQHVKKTALCAMLMRARLS
jgi:hypothetical protein